MSTKYDFKHLFEWTGIISYPVPTKFRLEIFIAVKWIVYFSSTEMEESIDSYKASMLKNRLRSNSSAGDAIKSATSKSKNNVNNTNQ